VQVQPREIDAFAAENGLIYLPVSNRTKQGETWKKPFAAVAEAVVAGYQHALNSFAQAD
jgi:hypothetical protein